MPDIIARPSSSAKLEQKPARLRRSFSYLSALLGFHFGSILGASKKAWGWALAVSGAVGVLAPLALNLIQRWVIPTTSQEAVMESLIWQIPLYIFIFLFVIMLFHVPFSKYQKLERDLAEKEKGFGESLTAQRTNNRALTLAIEEYKRTVNHEKEQKDYAREKKFLG